VLVKTNVRGGPHRSIGGTHSRLAPALFHTKSPMKICQSNKPTVIHRFVVLTNFHGAFRMKQSRHKPEWVPPILRWGPPRTFVLKGDSSRISPWPTLRKVIIIIIIIVIILLNLSTGNHQRHTNTNIKLHYYKPKQSVPPKANSAFHPSGVGKWVPASAGKAKAGMAHSVSGW